MIQSLSFVLFRTVYLIFAKYLQTGADDNPICYNSELVQYEIAPVPTRINVPKIVIGFKFESLFT